MKTKAINFLSNTGLGFLRWIKNNVLEQEPKPVAGVRFVGTITLAVAIKLLYISELMIDEEKK